MYNSIRGSFFRATPAQLFYSLVTDTLLYFFFTALLGPMGPGSTLIYLIFLPGFDFLCLIISFYHYVTDHFKKTHKK
mgnify:CR=1 FL=1